MDDGTLGISEVDIVMHPWSEEALFQKAKLYIGKMELQSGNGSQSGLLSALGLELLARAAISHISPSLLADGRDWRNLAFALDVIEGSDFHARSILSKELFERVHKLISDFTKEDKSFCEGHVDRRNRELHTGEFAFKENINWRPRFYHICKILVKFMDRDLNDLVSDYETAQKMIKSLQDTSAREVHKVISAHKTVWDEKTDEGRKNAASYAKAQAALVGGHYVKCPSCRSEALIQGESTGKPSTRIDGDEVIAERNMFPSSLECNACGLKIIGFSRLTACGLGSPFTSTTRSYMQDYEDVIGRYEDYLREYYT